MKKFFVAILAIIFALFSVFIFISWRNGEAITVSAFKIKLQEKMAFFLVTDDTPSLPDTTLQSPP